MKTLKFPIVRLTLFQIIGISIAHYFDISIIKAALIMVLSITICFANLIYSRKQMVKSIWFGITSYLAMICLGILSYNFHNEQNHNGHYTNIDLEQGSYQDFQLLLIERLKPSQYYDRFIVEIETIGWQTTGGKTILHIEKNNDINLYEIGDVLQCYSKIEEVQPPVNPHQFDYRKYLKNLDIHHSIRTKHSNISVIGQRNSIYRIADRFRNKVNNDLKTYNIKEEELAITNALLLGQKQNLERSTYQNYVNAGTIHILAVSGLHVGIILVLLNFIFKPIESLKHGKQVKAAVLLLFLWSFAIIAGLSASVTRAVTMFSVIAVAMNLRRPTNIYNTLCISLFFILLLKPKFLFHVGFQLSYIAVISIVSLQPLFIKLWSPKHKFVNFLWQTFTVTLSAQIGVTPISIYYFHQFPGLFFLSNLVIVPFLGIILSFGFIVILGSVLGILPQFIVEGFAFLISTMNNFVSWVSKQDEFIITNIYFDIWHLIAYYLMLIGIYQIFKRRNFYSVRLALLGLIILQIVWITRKQKHNSEMLVVFQKSKYTIICLKQGSAISVGHNLDSLIYNDRLLKDFATANNIKKIDYESISSHYLLRDVRLLIVDEIGLYNVKKYKPSHILLRNSPKVNLNRLIDTIAPKLIIADGSNYRSYVERWKATCQKKKIPFHSTYEKGAYILKYD